MGQPFQRVRELASAAEEYCALVEHLDRPDGDWLEQLSRLLPRIHAAVIGLGGLHPDACEPVSANEYELRFELYSHLRRLLGDRDHYNLEFDPGDARDMSGSLADDITDIYFELRRGLDVLDQCPDHLRDAASVWRTGFRWHWGQHLVDAERHLYELEVSNRLFRGCGVVRNL